MVKKYAKILLAELLVITSLVFIMVTIIPGIAELSKDTKAIEIINLERNLVIMEGKTDNNSTNNVYVSSFEDNQITNESTENSQINSLETSISELKTKITTLKASLIDKTYPLGSIYISIKSENPKILFGGTWQPYGTGRTLVGFDTNQIEFNAIEKVGGEKVHALTIEELPSHTHILSIVPGYTAVDPASSTEYYLTGVTGSANGPVTTAVPDSLTESKLTGMKYSGGGGTHNNLQPYITVFMWKRIG